MPNHMLRWSSLPLALIVLAPWPSAASVMKTAFFGGPEQTFDAATDMTGTVTVAGVTGVPLFTIPDQSHPISLANAPVLTSTNPVSLTTDALGAPLPQPGANVSFAAGDWFLEDVDDLHLDIFNGQTLAGAINTFQIDAFLFGVLPSPQDADFDFVISSLDFWQAAPAVFANPGAQQSDFTVPGMMRATFTGNTQVGAIFSDTVFDNEIIEVPLDLIGTATTTHDVPMNTTLVELDGMLQFDALFEETSLVGDSLAGATGTIDTAATLSFDIDYHLEVALSDVIPPTVPGDGNGDGMVGPEDYTLWANNFGMIGPNIPGDYNDDDMIGPEDYTVWANNFGMMSGADGPSVAAVPEPSGFLLAGAALTVLVASSPRRRTPKVPRSGKRR